MPKYRFRKWAQFGLRTFLVIVAIVCISVGHVANRVRDQRMAVNRIRELGGTVQYDFERFARLNRNASPYTPPAPAWVMNLLTVDYFHRVVVVTFQSNHKLQRDLRFIRSLPELEVLWIENGESITDADLVHLEGLERLQFLSLSGTQVEGEGLRHLRKNSGLIEITLDDSPIRDVGIEHLAGFTRLDRVSLRNTNVTDAGLSHMANWSAASYLDLTGNTRLSTEGVKTISHLKNLAVLGLQETSIDDGVVPYVLEMTALREFIAKPLLSEQAEDEIHQHIHRNRVRR